MLIHARAPLRLGLAGGGTDISPYCDVYGGYVLNATIDRYAYAVLRPLPESAGNIRFCATDQQCEEFYNISTPVSVDAVGTLKLHKAVYNYMMLQYNDGKNIPLELQTYCDVPIGSGLGSSSTLVVAMIKAFVEYMNLPMDDYAIAKLAFQIERLDCGLQGGRQDQYSATFGGINFIEFYANNHVIVNSLRVKNWILCELEISLLLFYTGVSRESAGIIKMQQENLNAGNEKTLAAMHAMKDEAIFLKESLLRGDFNRFTASMQHGWENKKSSASSVSNPDIEKIYTAAIRAGALAGKISGAGGGGFMLFFVPVESRINVVRALSQFHGEVSSCHFTKHGAQAWRLD